LPVESGGDENDGIPQEDWVMLITIQGPHKSGGGGVHEKRRVLTEPRWFSPELVGQIKEHD
jgi:hypothetical protein